jgi:hypothetical protein
VLGLVLRFRQKILLGGLKVEEEKNMAGGHPSTTMRD